MVSRRKFLKSSLIAGGVISTGLVFYSQIPADEISDKLATMDLEFFNEDDQIVLMAIVPVILAGTDANAEMVARVIDNMDKGILHLSLKTQKELRELFDLLANKLARAVVVGIWSSWSTATAEDIVKFLISWQNSSLDLLQIGYQGLKQLTLGSYYSELESWPRIGYAGPP